MKYHQRAILYVGLMAVLLASLFPPTRAKDAVSRGFLFSPRLYRVPAPHSSTECAWRPGELDLPRFIVEIVLICAATGSVVLFASRKDNGSPSQDVNSR